MAVPTIYNTTLISGSSGSLSFTPTAGRTLVAFLGRVAGGADPTLTDNEGGGSPQPWQRVFYGGGNPNNCMFIKTATGNETSVSCTDMLSPSGITVWEIDPSNFVGSTSARVAGSATTPSYAVGANSLILAGGYVRTGVPFTSWTNITDDGAMGSQRAGHNSTVAGSSSTFTVTFNTGDLVGISVGEFESTPAVTIAVDAATVSLTSQTPNIPVTYGVGSPEAVVSITANDVTAGEVARVGSPVTVVGISTLDSTLSFQTDQQTVTVSAKDVGVITDVVADLQTVNITTQPASFIETVVTDTGNLLFLDSWTTASWSNTDNLLSDDGNVASAGLPSGPNSTGYVYARSLHFGSPIATLLGSPVPALGSPPNPIGIPQDAEIDGISATVRYRDSVSAGGVDISGSVQLFKDGAGSGTPSVLSSSKGLPTTSGTAFTVATVGSSSDLWGLTWTPQEINSDGFGARLTFSHGAFTGNAANVDYVKVRVYYTYIPSDTESITSQSVAVGTYDINLPIPTDLQTITLTTQNANIKEDTALSYDAQSVVINGQNVLVAGDDVQTIDLQTVNVNLFNPTIPPVVVQTDLQTISITTQNASTADLEEITNTPSVTVTSLDGEVVGDVFVTADLQTVNLTTNNPELDETLIFDTQSVTVTTQDARQIFGVPVSLAAVSVNPLDAELDFAFIPDLAQVNISTFIGFPIVPPKPTLTLTSSIYRPVALTSRHVDLQFVTEDSEELIVIQTYGSPRSI